VEEALEFWRALLESPERLAPAPRVTLRPFGIGPADALCEECWYTLDAMDFASVSIRYPSTTSPAAIIEPADILQLMDTGGTNGRLKNNVIEGFFSTLMPDPVKHNGEKARASPPPPLALTARQLTYRSPLYARPPFNRMSICRPLCRMVCAGIAGTRSVLCPPNTGVSTDVRFSPPTTSTSRSMLRRRKRSRSTGCSPTSLGEREQFACTSPQV
jgi:hypothetical protein